jgi:hypothetical protein
MQKDCRNNPCHAVVPFVPGEQQRDLNAGVLASVEQARLRWCPAFGQQARSRSHHSAGRTQDRF